MDSIGQEVEIYVAYGGEAPADMPFGISDLNLWGDNQNENTLGIFERTQEQFND
jgi:hypothetical protein